MRPLPTSPPERRPASAVPNITGLRFLPHGTEGSLVNISAAGLLAESASRLPVGATVQVMFDGGFSPASADGRVARCEVAVMGQDGLLRYHIAIEFDPPIPMGDDVEQPAAALPAAKGIVNRW